jgi:copper chaperone CopZ
MACAHCGRRDSIAVEEVNRMVASERASLASGRRASANYV